MIIVAQNVETTIRQNIRDTLAQIKQSGVLNKPLVLNDSGPYCAVSFYTDSARNNLAFQDDSTSNPSHFVFAQGRTLYTPSDDLINTADGLSDTFAQSLYYVTATFQTATDWFNMTTAQLYDLTADDWNGLVVEDGSLRELLTTYSNSLNLLFPSVITASKDDPKFVQNADAVVIVPDAERSDVSKNSGDITYVVLNYNLIVPLNPQVEPSGLSEESKMSQADEFLNAIRLSLYQDRYRDGTCTFYPYDRSVDGTWVGNYKLVQNKAAIKIPMRCCYQATSASY